jgi:hypothetical protein
LPVGLHVEEGAVQAAASEKAANERHAQRDLRRVPLPRQRTVGAGAARQRSVERVAHVERGSAASSATAKASGTIL